MTSMITDLTPHYPKTPCYIFCLIDCIIINKKYQYKFVLSYSTLTPSYTLKCLIVCKLLYQNFFFSQNKL